MVKSTKNTHVLNVSYLNSNSVKTKTGELFPKMYSCFKFVSHYYIYIHDRELGLCYLKISGYLPFM